MQQDTLSNKIKLLPFQARGGLQDYPLIPKDVIVSGWIWEVETRRLQAPTLDIERRACTDVTSTQLGVNKPNRCAGAKPFDTVCSRRLHLANIAHPEYHRVRGT